MIKGGRGWESTIYFYWSYCTWLIFLSNLCIAGNYKLVCYYTNWAQYRPEPMKFFPENANHSLCTHLIYAFATMSNHKLAPYEWNDESEPWSKGMWVAFEFLIIFIIHSISFLYHVKIFRINWNACFSSYYENLNLRRH